MKISPKAELEKFEEEIIKLRKVRKVIVEGSNDRKALNFYGIRRIITTAKPHYKVVEEVEDQVAILTDLDSAGRKIYARLKKDFTQRGVKINDNFRNFLFKYTQLRQIEGLVNYINRLKEKVKYDKKSD